MIRASIRPKNSVNLYKGLSLANCFLRTFQGKETIYSNQVVYPWLMEQLKRIRIRMIRRPRVNSPSTTLIMEK